MIDRGKTKQASSRRLNRGLKEYRISQLPDPLICHVLSLLSTKEAVGTSILSTRWRNLWLWVHRFELSHWEFLDFNAFVSFGNRYFDSTRLSCIHNLKLTIDENEASYLTPWIDALVKSKIQHLCVRRTGGGSSFHEMPLSLYVCETLVSLKLVQLTLVDTEFVSLPCLKTMHLYNNMYPKETTFERLVSSCPVLEDLMIDVLRNDAKVYRVHSRSLKRLRFLRSSSLQSDSVPGVVIDAPLLCSLRISDGVSKMFIVKDMKCNAKLDISFDFGLEAFDESNVSSISHIRNFLSGISRVRDMTISAFTFEELRNDEEMHPREMNQISFSSVPVCLLSSLEFVDFAIWGHFPEMKLVRYLLESSTSLKKLTLNVNHDSIDYDIFYELLKIPRRSTICEEAVKTSVLSTRWRSLWLWVPRLELNSQDFTDLNAFVSFGNMFFNSDRASCIHKLKLTITIGEIDNVASYVSSWIDAAIKRKVQHLDLHWCGVSNFFTKPLKLYNSETLVDLKLSQVLLDDATLVYLPCLKTMHLEDNWYPNEATFEKLVSSCPVLEELNLTIHQEDTKTFRLQSRSLKKLNLVRAHFHFRSSDPGVVIDAPLLCCLSIYDYASESFIVNNLESNAKIDISLLFGSGFFDERKRSNVHSFLLGITRVMDMTLCANTFEIICRQYSELDLLPRFGYMSHLHVTSRISDLKWLPTFLDSCPNVKSFVLSWFCDYEKMISEEMSFPFVPQCMLSSLEYVDFKVRILGLTAEMKLIRPCSREVRSGDVPLYLVSWRGFIATYIEFGDDKAAAAATLYVAAETDAVTIFCAPSLT
uniref:F-box domain-containing protein n=1 Tax=Brassica campestris TaxID=3711 RepID=A0A3P6CPB0_BRACM|nr:unnamed protein product [Brassica rapa]